MISIKESLRVLYSARQGQTPGAFGGLFTEILLSEMHLPPKIIFDKSSHLYYDNSVNIFL
jgi:hypothetical protein